MLVVIILFFLVVSLVLWLVEDVHIVDKFLRVKQMWDDWWVD